MNWVKEGQLEKVSNYLRELYGLQTLAAKMNKPVVAVAPGHAFNSGACLLSALGHPIMTADSKMAFNECTFGFIPHSGATFYLSRLPEEFGTFMALTGLTIHGEDAKRVGLVDKVIHQPMDFEEHLQDIIYHQSPKPFAQRVKHEEQQDKGEEFYNKSLDYNNMKLQKEKEIYEKAMGRDLWSHML